MPDRQAIAIGHYAMRRFTRRTDAFLKKLENHAAMVALYFMYYNFARASDDPCNARWKRASRIMSGRLRKSLTC